MRISSSFSMSCLSSHLTDKRTLAHIRKGPVLLFFAFEVMTKAPLTHLLQIPQVPLICQVSQVAHDEGNPGTYSAIASIFCN